MIIQHSLIAGVYHMAQEYHQVDCATEISAKCQIFAFFSKDCLSSLSSELQVERSTCEFTHHCLVCKQSWSYLNLLHLGTNSMHSENGELSYWWECLVCRTQLSLEHTCPALTARSASIFLALPSFFNKSSQGILPLHFAVHVHNLFAYLKVINNMWFMKVFSKAYNPGTPTSSPSTPLTTTASGVVVVALTQVSIRHCYDIAIHRYNIMKCTQCIHTSRW